MNTSPKTANTRSLSIMNFLRFGRLQENREIYQLNEACAVNNAVTNGMGQLARCEGSKTDVAAEKRDAFAENNVEVSRCDAAKPENDPVKETSRGLGLGHALARLRFGHQLHCIEIRGSSTVGTDSSDQDDQDSHCDSPNQADKPEEDIVKSFERTSLTRHLNSDLSHKPAESPEASGEDGAQKGDETKTQTDFQQTGTNKDDKKNPFIFNPALANFKFKRNADSNDIPNGNFECSSSTQDVHQPKSEASNSSRHSNGQMNKFFGLSSVFTNLLSGRSGEKVNLSRLNESHKGRRDFESGLTHLQYSTRENSRGSNCSLDSHSNDSGGWRARNDSGGILDQDENESSKTLTASSTVTQNNWMDPLSLSNRESNDLVGLCSMFSSVADDENVDGSDRDTIGSLNPLAKTQPQQPTSCSLKNSFAGSFMNVDGINRMDGVHRRESDLANTSSVSVNKTASVKSDSGSSLDCSVETRIQVASEDGWFTDDRSVKRAKAFEENVLPKITTLEESHMLLRRTQAVLSLASRLMAAPDEQACFEETSKLLVVSILFFAEFFHKNMVSSFLNSCLSRIPSIATFQGRFG